MKKIIITMAILTVACFAASAQEPLLYSTKPLTAITTVNAETSGGSITVEGGHNADARIEVYVSRNNGRGKNSKLTQADAEQLIQNDYTLTIEQKGGTLNAVAKRQRNKRNRSNELSISFKIYVPTTTSTQLHSSGGSIQIADLSGTQKFSTAGGGLKIAQVSGTVDGHTAGGGINLSNSNGNINVRTAGGGVMVQDCDGTIHVETAGGSVKAEDVKGELYAHTAGGGVQLKEMSCSVDASTSGGNMDVTISDLGKYVKLNTAGGNINLQLPKDQGVNLELSGRHVYGSNLKNFQGSIGKDKISGALNGGGVPVKATASGDVRLNN